MEGSACNRLKQFSHVKRQCLAKEDLSRKGSIDEPIRCLVELINNNPYYYTTSTCSGRISLIEKPIDNPAVKKGGNFLMNSHQDIQLDSLLELIRTYCDKKDDTSCLWLKFEPFIVHIQCYDIEKAHYLLSTVIESGCRNSGLTIGKKDKFLIAVRSTSSMEVPIHCSSKFSLNTDYLEFLCNESNRRLQENLLKLGKFQVNVENALHDLAE